MSDPLKFSEAANLALHACAFLAADDGRMSAGRLAELMDVSQSHLAKVLQRLAAEDLLESTRGAAGGFRLALPAGELTLLELVETVDGPLDEGGCLLGKPVCGRDSCLFTDLMARTGSMVRRKLESVTLAELIREMPGFGRTGEKEE